MSPKPLAVNFLSWTLGLLFAISTPSSESARVLLIPQNINSHILYFQRLAEGLSAHGHIITMIVAENSQHVLRPRASNVSSSGAFEVLSYPTGSLVSYANSEELSKTILESAISKPNILTKLLTLRGIFEKFIASWLNDCERMMTDEGLKSRFYGNGGSGGIYENNVRNGDSCGTSENNVRNGANNGMSENNVRNDVSGGISENNVRHGANNAMPENNVRNGVSGGLPENKVRNGGSSGIYENNAKNGGSGGTFEHDFRNGGSSGKSAYDIAVVDGTGAVCQCTLPYKLGIPYITFGVPFLQILVGSPVLPSFVPSPATEYSDSMTFTERLLNTFVAVFPALVVNTSSAFSERHVPDKPPLSVLEFLASSAFFFHLRDGVLSYPTPMMPNEVDLGDIMASPVLPLPDELQAFMDSSLPQGVLIVSLGSYVDYIPAEIVDRLCQIFLKVEERVVWKSKTEASCGKLYPEKIRVMPWIPQNDLLGHRNTKLFLTHGGINSLIESVFHGVPMVIVPLVLDQHFNAALVESKGYGLRADIGELLTSDELSEKIGRVRGDESFAEKTRAASAIMRHKRQSAAGRASFWIDHVVKFGGAEHLRTKAVELPLMQFLIADIFVVCLALVVILLAVLPLSLCLILKCMKKILLCFQ